MNSEELRMLVAQFAVADGSQRGLAADSVVDLVQGTDQATGAVLSRALEAVLMIEDSDEALEAQMHALAEMAEWDLVPHDVIVRVTSSRAWDQPWAGEYVEYLLSVAKQQERRTPA